MSGIALALRHVRGQILLARHYRDAADEAACLDRARNLAALLIGWGV